jgi:hypothetical protein
VQLAFTALGVDLSQATANPPDPDGSRLFALGWVCKPTHRLLRFALPVNTSSGD